MCLFPDGYPAAFGVLDAIRALPPRQRAIIVLRYYDDLSESQIADALGCGPAPVKSQAAAALATLRGTLGAINLAAPDDHAGGLVWAALRDLEKPRRARRCGPETRSDGTGGRGRSCRRGRERTLVGAATVRGRRCRRRSRGQPHAGGAEDPRPSRRRGRRHPVPRRFGRRSGPRRPLQDPPVARVKVAPGRSGQRGRGPGGAWRSCAEAR